MKPIELAVSNIGFKKPFSPSLYQLFRGEGLGKLELAPSKFFPDWDINTKSLNKTKSFLDGLGIEPYAFQSLTYQVEGIALFSDDKYRDNLFEHLKKVFNLGLELGIRYFVFGAPKIRKTFEMDHQEIQAVALDFFSKCGNYLKGTGAALLIEACPKEHGNQFLTNHFELRYFLEELSHPHVGFHFDTGTWILNDRKDLSQLPTPKHIHLSAADLSVEGLLTAEDDIGVIFNFLQNKNYEGVASLEAIFGNIDSSLLMAYLGIKERSQSFEC